MLWPGGTHARQPILGRLDRAVLQQSPASCQPCLSYDWHSADRALAALLSRDRLRAPGVADRRRTVRDWMDLPVRRPRLRRQASGVFLRLALSAGGNPLVGGKGAGKGVAQRLAMVGPLS